MASRRILPALSLLLVGLLLPPGSLAQQAPSVGYDHRGQLVEQPRLKVNMFELADSAAEATKADLRVFGRWVADALQPVLDYAAHVRAAQSPAAVASLRARASGKNPVSPVALWHEAVTGELASFEALATQLKKARPPKAQHPDVARAVNLTGKDLVQVGHIFDRLIAARRIFAQSILTLDGKAMAGSLLVQVKEFADMQEWGAGSARRQIAAGVGGTPDLWLWRSQIEGSEAMATTFRDVLYLVENQRMPPPVNQANNQERLIAMAEWVKRAKLQVRHELMRARGSPDASLTRSRWLEGVYLNYEKTVAAEQASQEWLVANLPRFYQEMRVASQGDGRRLQLVQWDHFDAIAETQLVLTVERYRMLAAMP